MWHYDFPYPHQDTAACWDTLIAKGPWWSEIQGHAALTRSRIQVRFVTLHQPYAQAAPVVKENPRRLCHETTATGIAKIPRNTNGDSPGDRDSVTL
jgi:hypothetical protein